MASHAVICKKKGKGKIYISAIKKSNLVILIESAKFDLYREIVLLSELMKVL